MNVIETYQEQMLLQETAGFWIEQQQHCVSTLHMLRGGGGGRMRKMGVLAPSFPQFPMEEAAALGHVSWARLTLQMKQHELFVGEEGRGEICVLTSSSSFSFRPRPSSPHPLSTIRKCSNYTCLRYRDKELESLRVVVQCPSIPTNVGVTLLLEDRGSDGAIVVSIDATCNSSFIFIFLGRRKSVLTALRCR